MVIRPPVTSYSRGTSAVSEVFPGAGGAHEGEGLAGRQVEVDVAQDGRVGAGIGEVDVLEAQVAAGGRGRGRARDDVGVRVVDLEHPRRSGHRLLGHRQDHAQGGDRPHQRQHQRDERDQLAGGQRSPADADRPEEEHDHDGEVGDHLEEGPEPGRQAHLHHAGREQAPGPHVVLLRDVGRTAERLDHPDADRTLLGQRGEVALLVLDGARDDDVALLEAHRQPDDRGRRRRRRPGPAASTGGAGRAWSPRPG